MRDPFREFAFGFIPTPKFIGISSFGTQFCVYTFNTSETRPDSDPRAGPQRRRAAGTYIWAFDTLNDEGETELG